MSSPQRKLLQTIQQKRPANCWLCSTNQPTMLAQCNDCLVGLAHTTFSRFLMSNQLQTLWRLFIFIRVRRFTVHSVEHSSLAVRCTHIRFMPFVVPACGCIAFVTKHWRDTRPHSTCGTIQANSSVSLQFSLGFAAFLTAFGGFLAFGGREGSVTSSCSLKNATSLCTVAAAAIDSKSLGTA